MAKKKERATELEWLQYFYENADFGPAHEDVVSLYQQYFMKETGKLLPEGYTVYGEDEED